MFQAVSIVSGLFIVPLLRRIWLRLLSSLQQTPSSAVGSQSLLVHGVILSPVQDFAFTVAESCGRCCAAAGSVWPPPLEAHLLVISVNDCCFLKGFFLE